MKSVNAIRMLGMAQINKANSGHPGMVLGASPMAYELFKNHLNITPDYPNWYNRDRFILAAGHGSSMLYALLHLTGFDLSMDDLKGFRQMDSKTPGHPEYKHTEGIDATSGPLGQGIAMGVGMALAETVMANKYNKDITLFDYYTYVLCGDGDLQEGVTQEAMSFAGHNGINKLVVLYDSNDIQLDGGVSLAQSEDVKGKYEAMNWHYQLVSDGNDLLAIGEAIRKAKETDKPSIIEIKTIIGFGSKLAGDSASHGSPLGNDLTNELRKVLDWEYDDFEVPSDVYSDFQEIKSRGNKGYVKSVDNFKMYQEKYPELFAELNSELETPLMKFDNDLNEATRVSSGKTIDLISKEIPYFIGGSADLTKSTKAKGADGDFSKENRSGRNINYGVREHAMGAIANGITLTGMKTFTGAFFVFSDYMKPAMRMASLMNIPTTFVFTHDSVAVGEDGPTHEPVEQLAGIRAIPNMNVIRPANAHETAAAWKIAVDSDATPTTLVFTRQNLLNNSYSTYENVLKGAYIISSENKKLDGILLAAGSEVNLAIESQKVLLSEGIDVRVVSIPSMFMFDKQTEDYKEEVLPNVPTLAMEMGSAMGWYKYTKNILSIDEFGASAPGPLVVDKYGFNVDNVVKTFKNIL
ncbi:transketolase [Mycoplasmatota bacterium]|nr:transketolase [Mycoplasmatota bacterium]